MNTQIETVALTDDALETVSGGGIKSAIALGTWGAVQGGAGGGIAAGPVGAVGGGILGGAVGFISGLFIDDNAPAGERRRGLIH